jgi:cyclic pyranopterin phosphate synthase
MSLMSQTSAPPIRVLCFGALRERLGAERMVGERVGTAAELWSLLTRDCPDLAAARDRVRAARNLAYCDWETALEPGDEVAFMPPVAGGAVDESAAPALLCELVEAPIDVSGLVERLRRDAHGAVATFQGVVRDSAAGRPVLRLDYEAYPAMAGRELRRIGERVAERHALGGLALVHRTGSLAVGEVSLAVVTVAAHRAAALRACADAVELVKRDLPVWKREHHPDGAAWVDARELDGAQAAAEPSPPALSHLDASGVVRMVDVGDRPATLRAATAEAVVRCSGTSPLEALRRGSPKGDVLAVARLAGIMAAKRTPELIPLCHPLPLTHVDVAASVEDAPPGVRITASARCVASTGVEMEALTAAAVAALTVIDMLKSADPWMTVDSLRLLSKSGGRSGVVRRPPGAP